MQVDQLQAYLVKEGSDSRKYLLLIDKAIFYYTCSLVHRVLHDINFKHKLKSVLQATN